MFHIFLFWTSVLVYAVYVNILVSLLIQFASKAKLQIVVLLLKRMLTQQSQKYPFKIPPKRFVKIYYIVNAELFTCYLYQNYLFVFVP